MKSIKHTFEYTNKYTKYYSDYFKAMREDIITRINTHTKFVMQKIVTIAGAFAIAMSNNYFKSESDATLGPIFVLMLLPAIAYIYDIMIANNINGIHKIGCFIKHKIENTVNVEMWENYLGQGDKKYRCFGPLDIRILVLFDTALIICCFLGSIYLLGDYYLNGWNYSLLSNKEDPKVLSFWIGVTVLIVFFALYVLIYFVEIFRVIRRQINAKYDSDGKEEDNKQKKCVN